MIKSLTILFISFTTTVWCQVTVTGIVKAKEDHLPMPGVNVIIKGTTTGTTTSSDGTFSLNVNDPNDVLEFSFVGCIKVERPLLGQTHVLVTMKMDCIRDYFDAQRIGFYLSSGIINTPLGGQIDLSFPAYFGKGTLKAGVGYQTDLNKNEFLKGQVEFNHFIWTCNFEMDILWNYRNVNFGRDFDSRANSLETNLGFNRLRLIAGYSKLSLHESETTKTQATSGPVLGAGCWIGGPLRLMVTAKTAIYKNNIEYFAQINRDSQHLSLFVKFYKLDSFTELSLGVGTEIGYRLRKQKR